MGGKKGAKGPPPCKLGMVIGDKDPERECWTHLGNAIVAQAVKDYKDVLERLCLKYETGQNGNLHERFCLYDCLDFFFGNDEDNMFSLLCPQVRPEVFIQMLNKVFEKEYLKYYGRYPNIEGAIEYNERLTGKLGNQMMFAFYNEKYHQAHDKRLDDATVREIRRLYDEEHMKPLNIAQKFGMTPGRIGHIIHRRVYKYI